MNLFAYDDPPKPKVPGTVTLRPYQVKALDSIEEGFSRVQRGLIVLATGLGKTTIFTEQARRTVEKGGKVLILAHREELLEQARDRIHHQCPGVRASIEGGDRKASAIADVVVASVQTVGRASSSRLEYFKPDLVICDEAHHAAADGYMIAARKFGCFDGKAKYLGVTATAHRLDNKPLHGAESGIFEEVFYDYPIKPAIQDGWLCDIRAFRVEAGYSLDGVKKTAGDYNQRELESRVNNERDNQLAVHSWQEVSRDRQTIVFCTGVAHAAEMQRVFEASGISSACVTGATQKEERREIMDAYKAGRIQVLTNCDVATEGFDAPETGCILLMRPTQSWVKYVQMVGRGLRLADGKEDCIVLDVGGTGDGKSLVTVPGMLGLPSQMRPRGESIKDMMDVFDELTDDVKAKLSGRKFDFGDIESILKKVDILADLEPSAELKSATRLAWQEVAEDHYCLQCGSERTGTGLKRTAILRKGALGDWRLIMLLGKESIVDMNIGTGALGQAMRVTDQIVSQTWPDAMALVNRDAPWRKRSTKSPKQMEWLRKFGLSNEEIAQMNGGQVSAFLDRKFSERKR